MTSDGLHTYTYDANGNVVEVDGGNTATYTYDALNQRVRVDTPGSDSIEYVYNINGQRVSIWDADTQSQVQGQAYWGSMPIEFYAGGTAHFETQDWEGTERLQTSYNGSVEGTYTSLPYGDGYSASGTDDDAYHFAGLDQDNSANEHAQYREYSNMAGRWMSPDPYFGSYDFSNPQSFNRYSYVMNNPLAFTDTIGMVPCYIGGAVTVNGQGQGTDNPNNWEDVSAKECAADGGQVYTTFTTVGVTAQSDDDNFDTDDDFDTFGLSIPILTAPLPSSENLPIIEAPNNLINVSLTNTKPCSASGAFSLDYSQPLFNGGTQTSQQHIMQRHGGSGLPGVSQYNGNFGQIQNLNMVTYLFGSQTLQGNSVVFQFSLPQAFSPIGLYSYIGTDANGQPTSTNRLITTGNCKTVVTSYPISDPVPIPYP